MTRAIAHGKTAERQALDRAIWRVAKRYLRSLRPQLPLLPRSFDATCEMAQPADCMEDVLALAKVGLTDRQAEILKLTILGSTISEIAQSLGTSPARISDDKYRAIRRLRNLIRDERA